jgi:hypothetical protein
LSLSIDTVTLRETVSVPCPGTRENLVQLTNSFTTPFGIQNPFNNGSCTLFLGALDSSGTPVDPGSDLELPPGEGASAYYAPSGADVIVVVCKDDCSGIGELIYDAPDA